MIRASAPGLFLLVAVLLVASAGCASLHARRARTERLQSELDALRYRKPIEEVWQEARRTLADRGFPLADEDAAAVGQGDMGFASKIFSPARATRPLTDDALLARRLGTPADPAAKVRGLALDTGWGKGTPRHRRHLEAYTDGDEVRVAVFRIVEEAPEQRETTDRDLELELELARRLDPAAAERIDAALASARK
ncbi:MAG TPA: hypothetical protein VFK85_09785 [Anaeromyxobacteraceae bacterium]|nr:hypothetical protein [Anaeromyxobacteraceae bacterium]